MPLFFVISLQHSGLLSAKKAKIAVDAEGSSAFWAAPFYLLAFNELPYADFLDILQILEHAHPILCPVPFVQLLEPGAGEDRAGKTEPFLPGAMLDAAMRAVMRLAAALHVTTGTFVLLPKIGQADTTVHPAGGDQLG